MRNAEAKAAPASRQRRAPPTPADSPGNVFRCVSPAGHNFVPAGGTCEFFLQGEKLRFGYLPQVATSWQEAGLGLGLRSSDNSRALSTAVSFTGCNLCPWQSFRVLLRVQTFMPVRPLEAQLGHLSGFILPVFVEQGQWHLFCWAAVIRDLCV